MAARTGEYSRQVSPKTIAAETKGTPVRGSYLSPLGRNEDQGRLRLCASSGPQGRCPLKGPGASSRPAPDLHAAHHTSISTPLSMGGNDHFAWALPPMPDGTFVPLDSNGTALRGGGGLPPVMPGEPGGKILSFMLPTVPPSAHLSCERESGTIGSTGR